MPRRATEESWSAEPLSHCKQGGQCRGRRTVSTGVAAGRDRHNIPLAAAWTVTRHWSLEAHSGPLKQGCGPPLVYNPSGL